MEKKVPLTVCPLSNIKLCVFNELKDHNLKTMLDRGLHVMVNSDDPAYFGGYLGENLFQCHRDLNLTKDDLKKNFVRIPSLLRLINKHCLFA